MECRLTPPRLPRLPPPPLSQHTAPVEFLVVVHESSAQAAGGAVTGSAAVPFFAEEGEAAAAEEAAVAAALAVPSGTPAPSRPPVRPHGGLSETQAALLLRLRNVKVVRVANPGPQGAGRGWAASHEAALPCRAPTSQVRCGHPCLPF